MRKDPPEHVTMMASTPSLPTKCSTPVIPPPPTEATESPEVEVASGITQSTEADDGAEPQREDRPIGAGDSVPCDQCRETTLPAESTPLDSAPRTPEAPASSSVIGETSPEDAAAAQKAIRAAQIWADLKAYQKENPPEFSFQLHKFNGDSQSTHDLVEGLIPGHGIQEMVGTPGSGKSLLATALAAKITTGEPFGGRAVHQGEVIYVTGEDDVDSVVVPRLRAHGADLDKMYFHGLSSDANKSKVLDLLTDHGLLERKLECLPRVRAIFFDPLAVFLGSTDVTRIRVEMVRLQERLRSLRVALFGVSPLRENSTKLDAAILDGLPLASVASSVLHVTEDQRHPQRRRVRWIKSKVCEPHEMIFDLGENARLSWVATPKLSLQVQRDPTLSEVKEWILAELAGGPKPAREMEEQWKAAHFAPRTVARAKAAVRARSKHIDGVWYWYLVDDVTT
jgi:hypothetical protein